MPGPTAMDPTKRQRGNKTSTKATLQERDPDTIKIPPLPEPEDYIGSAFPAGHELYQEARWNGAVVRWWQEIWSSPMSSEFTESDMHGLYLGCTYLHQMLNPLNKATEKTAYAMRFEGVQKNFGLNPMARRSLQWEIARGEEAVAKTAKRKTQKESDVADEKRAQIHVLDPRKVAGDA